MDRTGETPGPPDPSPLAPVEVIVLASSAGGIGALVSVLSGLGRGLGVPVVAVQHLSADHVTDLANILARKTDLDITFATDGESVHPGHVYLAPAAHHLSFYDDGRLRVSDEAKVDFHRPSADVLFESAADIYGSRTLAVVLSGTGHDASRGAEAIKRAGGTVIASDAATSQFFGMPGSAIATGAVEMVLPEEAIADAIRRRTGTDGRTDD